jgi:hypothetical protein
MEHRSNPVLNADWPDPDVIRVGDEFWMITSSFNRTPGLPVLRSTNLVDWEHVTNALPALPPVEHFRLPRRGGGVWAPSLREHAGTFYIVYPDPDHGIFVLSAPHPAGPWSEPWLLLEGRGLIDPCPVWDAGGTAHLVHGWARSRAGVKNRLTALPVSADLRRPLGPRRVVVDGDEIDGARTLEGPKVYRYGGWYWIYAPAGGVTEGFQMVFRSRDIRGPYEYRTVLEQGTTPVNGPHQGGLVDDPDGNWWFVHFQDRGVFGRVTHVQPVVLDAEGWPHMGEPIDDVRGQPVLDVPPLDAPPLDGRPEKRLGPSQYTEPVRSDPFTSSALLPHWHWQANPEPGWARTGDGTLSLAFGHTPRGDLRDLGAVLGQQLPGRPSSWQIDLTLPAVGRPSAGDERAGITVLGLSYAWAGLRRADDGVRLEAATMDQDAHTEVLVASELLTDGIDQDVRVRLELQTDEAGRVHIGAGHVDVSGGGSATRREPAGARGLESSTRVLLSGWQSTVGRWIGAEVGLFATTTDPSAGFADPSAGSADPTARSTDVSPNGDGPRRAMFGPLTVRCEGRDA